MNAARVSCVENDDGDHDDRSDHRGESGTDARAGGWLVVRGKRIKRSGRRTPPHEKGSNHEIELYKSALL